MQFLLNFILISSFFLIPNASLSSEKLRVQLKWKHQFQFAGYYAAIEKGFYKESNLDVELIEANEEKKDLEGVLSGEVDIGIAGSNLVLLKSRGLPVVVLGTIFQHSPLAFLVPGRSGIGNVHEIQNKRLMLEGHAEELLAYLKSEGIRIETMNTVPHEFDIKFLLDGSVDVISAYQTDEPFLLKENKIPYYLFTPRSVGIDFYGDTIYTTRDTLHEKKDAILLFLDATYKGWSYALKHKEEIVDLIYDKYSQRHSRAHLLFEAEETEKLILPDIVELGYFNPGRWEQIAEQYKKINMLEGEFTLNEFLLERNPEKDLIWIYYYLLIIGGGICIALYLAFRYLQFNKFITEQTEELKIKNKWLNYYYDLPIIGLSITEAKSKKWIWCNQKLIDILGFTREELKTIKWTEITHPDDLSIEKEKYNDLLTERISNYSIEKRFIKKDNSIVFVRCDYQKIYDDIDQSYQVIGVINDITENKVLQSRLELLSNTDSLTGFYNRHFFDLEMEEIFTRLDGETSKLSFLCIDIDHLKMINEKYGHIVGDETLASISSFIKKNIAVKNMLSRTAGDEFGIVLFDVNSKDAYLIAEEIRSYFSQTPIQTQKGSIFLTLSIGVAEFYPGDRYDDLLKRADRALNTAKHTGRNQVIIGV